MSSVFQVILCWDRWLFWNISSGADDDDLTAADIHECEMVMVMTEMTLMQVHTTSCCDLSDQITIDRRPQADLRLKPTKSPLVEIV